MQVCLAALTLYNLVPVKAWDNQTYHATYWPRVCAAFDCDVRLRTTEMASLVKVGLYLYLFQSVYDFVVGRN